MSRLDIWTSTTSSALAEHRVQCLAGEYTAHQVAGRLAGVLRWQHHLHFPFQPIPGQDVHLGGTVNV